MAPRRSCLLLLSTLLCPSASAATYRCVGQEVVIEAERYTRAGGTRGGEFEARPISTATGERATS